MLSLEVTLVGFNSCITTRTLQKCSVQLRKDIILLKLSGLLIQQFHS